MQVTFTSDMGNQNAALAVLRSALYAHLPEVRILDITHDIPLGKHIQAVYHLKSSLYYFPDNTIHLVLVDMFNNLDSFLLLAKYQQQYYIAPNNGILSMLLPKENFEYVKAIPIKTASANLIHTQALFHTMVWCIKKIVDQEQIENFTKNDFTFLEKTFPRPIQKHEIDANDKIIKTILTAYIIFIDNFGNLVVNITIEEFLKNQTRKLKIILKERFEINKISSHYNDVARGSLVAFFNANGFLEIGINGSSLAREGFVEQQTAISHTQFYFDINDYYKTIHIEFLDE